MTALVSPLVLWVFLVLGQGHQHYPLPTKNLSPQQKAAIREAADSYWRAIDGTNVWLAPLVSFDMGIREDRPRYLTNWIRVIGRGQKEGKNLLVVQDRGRVPSVLVITNYPAEKLRTNRVNSYVMARGQTTALVNNRPSRVPLYDFGKITGPADGKKLSITTNNVAAKAVITNSVPIRRPGSPRSIPRR